MRKDEKEKIITRYLARRMKPDQGQSLDDMTLGRIGEFIVTTNEENLVIIEHWIEKAREQREGLRDGTAWHR